jgi:mercuric reductase
MKYELQIDGMTCLACEKSVEQALAALPGVQQGTVSYATKRGHVTGDERVTPEALRRAVADAGYHATVDGDAGAAAAVVTAAHHPAVAPAYPAPRDTRAVTTSPAADDGSAADYDLLVIGTGGAGMAAAIRASELGVIAAIVEQADVVGGTCVNVGCIPSKNLIEAAHHYHAARSGFPGIAPCEPQLAWDAVLRQKRELVDSLRQQKYLDVLDAYEGITLLRGRAELTPETTSGTVAARIDDRTVRARKIVVATGTRPAMPPIPGLADVGALDSTTAMELERLPVSMLVVGAGAIGLELGQTFQRFGVRVVVVEALERILPTEDESVSTALTQALTAEGLELHTSTQVTRAERTTAGVRLEVRQGSLTGYLEAEQLLIATGRAPNTEALGLEALDVRTDRRGYVVVDEFMRTSNPRVFAAGDVTGGPGYVYVAALQGGIAAQTALADIVGEEPIAAEMTAVPRVTFTDPQVAAVGLTEAESREAGLAPQVTTLPIEYLPRAAVSYRRQGMIRLVSEAGTDRLLGAHIVAPNAGDIISEAVLAVRFGLTTRDLVSTLHPYLTWGEAIKLAAQTFTKDVAKLSCCA